MLIKKNQKGETLIAVMIAMSIGLLVALSMATLMNQSSKQIADLRAQLDAVQNENLISQYLNSNQSESICSCHLDPSKNITEKNLHFSVNNLPQKINLSGLRSSCQFNSNSNYLIKVGELSPMRAKVLSIDVVFTKKIAPGSYEGAWRIQYDSIPGKLPIPNAEIPQLFNVDDSIASDAVVTACRPANSSSIPDVILPKCTSTNNCSCPPQYNGIYTTTSEYRGTIQYSENYSVPPTVINTKHLILCIKPTST